MDPLRARSKTDATKAARANKDDRWVERLARAVDDGAALALYPSITAYAATEFGLSQRRAYAHLSAGRCRLRLKAAGIGIPTGIGVDRLALTATQTETVIAAITNGEPFLSALDSARTPDAAVGPPVGLLPAPTEARDDVRLPATVESLALVTEALAYSTPVADLRRSVAAIEQCRDGLSLILNTLNDLEGDTK